MDVVQRAGDRPPPNRFSAGGGPDGGGMNGQNGRNVQTLEMLIPGTKCGLIIGKGGETIKNIQETAGVKMILIQERQDSGPMPKPLRIIGEPEKVEHAKRLVEEIMNSREDQPPHGGGGPGGPRPPFNAYGSPMGGGPMGPMGGPPGGGGGGPRSIGEVIVPRQSVGMIIGKGGETIKRLAMESGAKIQFKPDEDQNSADRCAIVQGTTDQITRATQLISDLVNKSGGAQEVFYMHVPANKTGLVIGKGGETIKAICGESGAHVELSREPPPNAMEKIFVIKGTPNQIHHAQHIVRIKVGDLPPGTPVPLMAGGGGADFGGQAAFNPSAQYGQQNAGAWPNAYGGMPQQQQPDPNAAAWNAYYGQQQPQQQQPFGQPAAPYQMQPAQPQQPQQQQQQQQPQQPQQQQQQAPAINPQTGQPDYSAQWAEYYRSLGMHEQANMIEQQAKAGAAGGAAPQQQQPVQQQAQPAVVPGQQRPQAYGAQFGGAAPQQQFGQFGAPQAQPQQTAYAFQAQY